MKQHNTVPFEIFASLLQTLYIEHRINRSYNILAAFAMSAGCANLPKGIPLVNTALPASESTPPKTLATIPVSATTGHIAFTRIPNCAISAASPLVTADTAPFEPAYQTKLGRGRMAETDEMLTNTPLFCFSNMGWTAAAEWYCRLVSKRHSHASFAIRVPTSGATLMFIIRSYSDLGTWVDG
jgi:hypothetical protein